MNVPILLMATWAVAASDSGETSLMCKLLMPNGSQFRLNGRFDKDGLHSNLSVLTKVEGVLAPTAPEPLVSSDGTTHYRWSLNNGSRKFDASLIQYGSGEAALILERHRFVGRHFARSLIGAGFCDLRRGRPDGKAS